MFRYPYSAVYWKCIKQAPVIEVLGLRREPCSRVALRATAIGTLRLRLKLLSTELLKLCYLCTIL